MQITKKDGNRYVKELDKVDLYLLNMMKRFFNADTEGIRECAESIILEAVKRSKDEILIKGKCGVQSVNLKTGIVSLTAGVSTGRPTSPQLGDAPYFDTTLNKPIWWSGSNWVDAMGNLV